MDKTLEELGFVETKDETIFEYFKDFNRKTTHIIIDTLYSDLEITGDLTQEIFKAIELKMIELDVWSNG